GGAGMLAGLLIISFGTALGLCGHLLMHRRQLNSMHGLAMGVAAALASGGLLLWLVTGNPALPGLSLVLPVVAFNILATSLAGLILITAERIAAERDLLAAAINQMPHYAYVKNRHGIFVAVNGAFARLNGYSAP